jgi:hypothetical protein
MLEALVQGYELAMGNENDVKLLSIQSAEILIGRKDAEALWNNYFSQVDSKYNHFRIKRNNYETAFYMMQGAMAIYQKRSDQR